MKISLSDNPCAFVQLPWHRASMRLTQTMEAEARLNLETEIDAGNSDDVKLCIRMQTPKFVTKVKKGPIFYNIDIFIFIFCKGF